MAHHAAKLPACANCHYPFARHPEQPDEFCPRCGQQNQEVNLSFGHVLEEALEGFFHFDGKVWQTLRLLLFRPGELTRRFLAGHRVGYVPPIRLYVFISFLFFFLLSLKHGSHSNKPLRREFAEKVRLAQKTGKPESLNIAGINISINPSKSTSEAGADTARSLPLNFSGSDLIKTSDLDKLPDEASGAQIDSLIKAKGAAPTFLTRLTVQRNLRWRDASLSEIGHQLLRGFSLLLFLLMPLAALLLKGAYVRRSRRYLGHLIFTIHLHCFLFLMLTLSLGLNGLMPDGWDLDELLLMLAVGVYFVLALRRVYAQSWLKTIAKSLLLGFAYFMSFLFSMVVVMFLGLAFF